MSKIKDLNPTIGDVGGSDLAIPFSAFGEVGYCWGDTFGGGRPAVGGPNWRSPVILWGKAQDVGKPIEFTSAAKGGAQLWDYKHDNAEFSTVLPCDVLEIDGRLYVWVMVTKGLGNERWCEIWYSDDRGGRWTNTNVRWSTSAFGSRRVMISWAREPGTDTIYVISTGGLARDKGMLLWRANVKTFLDPAQWEGWCYASGKWSWVKNPGDRQPSEILPGWKFGEIGLRFIQGYPVISGFDAGNYSIFVMAGKDIYQDWTKAPVARPVTGMPRGVDTVPRLYGGYVHPDSKFDGTFCVIVSEWAASGNPYRAMQFTFRPPAAPGPLKTLPAPAAPTPTKEPVMAGEVDIARVTGAGETTVEFDAGNPGAAKKPLNLWGAVKRILHETTLWTQLQTEKALRERHGKQDTAETTHGHARDASSGARVIIAQNDKILRNQAKIGTALKLTDLEK